MTEPSPRERAIATDRAYDAAGLGFSKRTAARSDMAADFFDRFVSSVSPNGLVADLGCGPGHDLRRLARAGHRAIGIDRSFGLLELSAVLTLRVRGDLAAVPMRDGSLDGIWSSAALLHIDGGELHRTFREWKRVLADGGVVGFATSLASNDSENVGWELVPAGPSRRPELPKGEQRWFVHHSQDQLLEAAEAAGLEVTWSQVRTSHRNWLQVLARS